MFQDCSIKGAERSVYTRKLGDTVARLVQDLPAALRGDVYLRRWLAPRKMTKRKCNAVRDHPHSPQRTSNSIATFFTAFAFPLRLRGQKSLDVSKFTLHALINRLLWCMSTLPDTPFTITSATHPERFFDALRISS